MTISKKSTLLIAVVAALSAISVASASAAALTYSATGTLAGKSLTGQTLTTSAGQVKCLGAQTTGSITSTNSSEQHITVNYKSCTALGFVDVDVSPATYLLTASGTAHLQGPITINVTSVACHLTVSAQELKPISYVNGTSGEPPKHTGRVKVTTNASGVSYTSTGGLCGASGSNGTFTGTSELERLGGGSITFDA